MTYGSNKLQLRLAAYYSGASANDRKTLKGFLGNKLPLFVSSRLRGSHMELKYPQRAKKTPLFFCNKQKKLVLQKVDVIGNMESV